MYGPDVKRSYLTETNPNFHRIRKPFFLPLENNKVSNRGGEGGGKKRLSPPEKSGLIRTFYKPTPSRGKGARGKSEILEGNKKKVKVVDRFVVGT